MWCKKCCAKERESKQWRVAKQEKTACQGQIGHSAATLALNGPVASIQSGVLSVLLLTSPPPTVFGTLHTPPVSSLLLWLDLRGWPPLLCRLHHQDPFLTEGSQSCSWSRKPSWAVWLFTLRGRGFFFFFLKIKRMFLPLWRPPVRLPIAVKSSGSSLANLLLDYGAKDTLTTSNRHIHTLTHTHTHNILPRP